jgi:hypothetical protein
VLIVVRIDCQAGDAAVDIGGASRLPIGGGAADPAWSARFLVAGGGSSLEAGCDVGLVQGNAHLVQIGQGLDVVGVVDFGVGISPRPNVVNLAKLDIALDFLLMLVVIILGVVGKQGAKLRSLGRQELLILVDLRCRLLAWSGSRGSREKAAQCEQYDEMRTANTTHEETLASGEDWRW